MARCAVAPSPARRRRAGLARSRANPHRRTGTLMTNETELLETPPATPDADISTAPRSRAGAPLQEDAKLTEIIVVTSGKGGVGKTTTSASLTCGLARRGHKVAVIDFDVGLRNLDLIMGCERRVVYDFVNVVNGEASLKQALIRDKRFDNLYVLAAS